MAMANVADILARRGLKVLMVDFDLEAPGLEQFFRINHDGVRRNPGVERAAPVRPEPLGRRNLGAGRGALKGGEEDQVRCQHPQPQRAFAVTSRPTRYSVWATEPSGPVTVQRPCARPRS